MGCGNSLVSKNIFNFIELRIYEKFIGVARKMHILKNVTKLTAKERFLIFGAYTRKGCGGWL